MAAIAAAVAQAHLTPGEAAELSNMVGNYVKALEAAEVDERLRAVEARVFAENTLNADSGKSRWPTLADRNEIWVDLGKRF